ncbi:CAP domain-containing protein [Paracoccus sp. S-4012]|nr:CAP domain-containing protein [Paracoccus sp. S-4012]
MVVPVPAPGPGAAASPRTADSVSFAETAPARVAAPSGACAGPSAAETAALVAATNEARVARGLAKVRAHPTLSHAAAAHSCDMATRGTLSHAGSSTRGPGPRLAQAGYGWAVVAENIAVGPRWDAGQALAQWNLSPGHLANILHPQAREVGIGGAFTADGMGYWTAVYAAPR